MLRAHRRSCTCARGLFKTRSLRPNSAEKCLFLTRLPTVSPQNHAKLVLYIPTYAGPIRLNPMTNPTLIKREASIVIMGSFNPAIFRPTWFLQEKIIGPNDVDTNKDEFVTSDIARFTLSWGLIEVLTNRFLVQTNDQGYFSTMRDLVVHVFATLGHTPVKQFGINGVVEYQLPDEKTWKAFGDVLAPKPIWEKILSEPGPIGLLTMTMQVPRQDGLKGVTNIQLAGAVNRGIRFDINNHIELEDGGTGALLQILSEKWDRLQDDLLKISETILNETLTCIPKR